jgi:hypothetical protein
MRAMIAQVSQDVPVYGETEAKDPNRKGKYGGGIGLV